MEKQPKDNDGIEHTPNGGARPAKPESKPPAAGSPEQRMRRGILEIQDQLRRSGVFAIQDAMRQSAIVRAVEECQRAMLLSQEQIRRFQESIRIPFRAMEEWQRSLLAIQEQLRQDRLRISAVFRVAEEWPRNLLAIQEQMRQSRVFAIQEALRQSAVFRVAEEWQRASLLIQEKLYESGLLGIEKVLRESSISSLVASISDIQGTLAAFREWADVADEEAMDDDTLVIGPDGSVTLAGEAATAAEVESAFRDLFDRFNDFLTNVRSALLNLRKPVRVLILRFAAVFLVPFLISYYFQRQATLELQEMQQRLQVDTLKTRREIIAAIKRLGPAHLDVKRSEYRVVIKDGVRVRSRPNRRAPAKGLLPLGTLVHFIEKRGP